MNFDEKEIAKMKHGVFVISGDCRAEIVAIKKIGKSMAVYGVSMSEFVTTVNNLFSIPSNPLGNRLLALRGISNDPFSYNEDFEDHGPDFDNRSWAFLERQQKQFEKQNKFKKHLFTVITNQTKLYKLKSMDSRSGYRGIKTLKRG